VNITGNHFYGAVPIPTLEAPYLPTPTQTITPPTYGGVVITGVDSTGVDTTATFYNINITGNIFENAGTQINHVKKLNFSGNTFLERNAVYTVTAPWLINLDASTGLFTGNTILEQNTPARRGVFFTTNKDMVISNNNITSDTAIIDKFSAQVNFLNNKATGGNITVANGYSLRNNDITGNIYSSYLTGGTLSRDIVSNKANSIAIAPGDTGTILRDNNVVAILDSGANSIRISNIVNGILEAATNNYKAKSTSYTATSTDRIIEVTATGQTITLPTAVGITGRDYTIKLTASGSATVATTSSQTIDAATTYSLSAQYKYVTVESNGANWIIIANN
jgi:hypothetical protein